LWAFFIWCEEEIRTLPLLLPAQISPVRKMRPFVRAGHALARADRNLAALESRENTRRFLSRDEHVGQRVGYA
jgi:hypothetical protein